MAIKVLIQPVDGGYKATCRMLGYEVVAESKEEASRKINAMIKAYVEKRTASGDIPAGKAAPSCASDPACRTGGCSGCK